MKKTTVVVAALALSACASTGSIQIGRDTYMISQTNNAGMFGSVDKVAAGLAGEAAQFCASLGKQSELITTKTDPTYPGHIGGATVTFRCFADNDPRYGSPTLRPDHGVTTLEIRQR